MFYNILYQNDVPISCFITDITIFDQKLTDVKSILGEIGWTHTDDTISKDDISIKIESHDIKYYDLNNNSLTLGFPDPSYIKECRRKTSEYDIISKLEFILMKNIKTSNIKTILI